MNEQDDELDDDNPLWLANAQIKGLLEGDGASEDHEGVLAFLRSTGLPEGTVRRVHRAIVCGDTKVIPDYPAIVDVLAERARQTKKWGEQNHDLSTWSAILSEENGEFAQACLHYKFGGPAAKDLRAEAVQVAAVAVQIVEFIDRAGVMEQPLPALWLCCQCGHEFAEKNARRIDTGPGDEDREIACPKCFANNSDQEGLLKSPSERRKA